MRLLKGSCAFFSKANQLSLVTVLNKPLCFYPKYKQLKKELRNWSFDSMVRRSRQWDRTDNELEAMNVTPLLSWCLNLQNSEQQRREEMWDSEQQIH